MDFAFFFEVESSYEKTLANKSLDFFPRSQLRYLSWLVLLEKRQFIEFYRNSEELLRNSESLNEKVFLFSWLIVATEVQYDLKRRNAYLIQLEALSAKEFNPYLEYQKLYFQSVSYFYDANLLLSEVLIDRCLILADSLNYVRGKSRCLYHKALICSETNRVVEFKSAVSQAMQITSNHLLLKTKEKVFSLAIQNIQQQDQNKTSDIKIDDWLCAAERALAQNDFKYARQLLARAESLRRKVGFKKNKFSIFVYYIHYYLKTRRINLARRLLKNTTDKVLKLKIFSIMKSENIEFTAFESEEYKKIIFHLNIAINDPVQEINLTPNLINLKKIKSESVKKLLIALAQSESLDKEKLFQFIYEIPYDPVIHDTKIYKLVLKAKKELAADLIVNSYGKYSLNNEKYKVIS